MQFQFSLCFSVFSVSPWCEKGVEITTTETQRTRRSTEISNCITTLNYDGFGHKTEMTDPDMGTWDYDYDDNGSLIYQRDAKGQIILMGYDVLNRITRKDLPPNDPVNAGPEDTAYFYDGEGPAP